MNILIDFTQIPIQKVGLEFMQEKRSLNYYVAQIISITV